MRDAVDGRSGLHAQRREALAPAALVLSVVIAVCERVWRRAVLLVLLLLLVSFCGRLVSRGTGGFVEGIRRRRRKDGIRRIVGGDGIGRGMLLLRLRLVGLGVVCLVLLLLIVLL